jgi:hypothetical protein
MSVQPTDLKAFINLAATGKPLTASQAEQATPRHPRWAGS